MEDQLNTTKPEQKKKRLLSVDALRGFDMFWILGGEKFFAALFIITGWSFFHIASLQMVHSTWHGFTAYDLIFPLFIFLSGVSLGITGKPLSHYPPEKAKSIVLHGVKRLVILMLLGVIYNHGWGKGIPADIESIRVASVLGRIGISWFVAALLVWFFSERIQWIFVLVVLLGYWLLLSSVSIAGLGDGDYSADGAINVWFDQHFLPGAILRNKAFDPEGVLSNLPSIINALFGVFTGRFIIKYSANTLKLTSFLILAGISMVILGYVWGIFFPINKTLWTSSFVLVTSGFSILLLTLFYVLIDVVKIRAWATFFAVIGTNSIVVYVGSSVVSWGYISKSFLGGLINIAPPGWSSLIFFGGVVLFQWLVLYWLYCRKIFIKI